MGSQCFSLLLLPPPPLSTLSSTSTTKAAYGPAIEETLRSIKQTANHRLDVAISVPQSWLTTQDVSRTALFERAQKTLAVTYSLICATAASQHLELDCLGGLDARAFLLLPIQDPASEQGIRDRREKPFSGPFSGPLVDLVTFVESGRTYPTLYAVQSDEGERCAKTFILLYEAKHSHRMACQRVPSGLSITQPSDFGAYTPTSDRSHTSVAVGGTFDHLHIGHKLLLTAAALLAEPKGSPRNPTQTVHLTIGISGDELLTKKKFAEELENWEERRKKVSDFLASVIFLSSPFNSSRKVEHISTSGPTGRCVRSKYDTHVTIDFVQISDPFGPTITDENISALVLSQETRSGGSAINEKRQRKDWAPLDVFEIDVLEIDPGEGDRVESNPISHAFESKISSTAIRQRIHEARNIGT